MTLLPWRMRRQLPSYGSIAPWADIEHSWGLSPLGARLAWMRHIDADELAWRLDPSWLRITDPFLLPGVSVATARIHQAIADSKPICVYGDYDVDGITATALMVRVLEKVGAKVSYFIPNRFNDGYGLNLERIKELVAVNGSCLMISVDCGVNSLEEVKNSRSMGVEWIITDHHVFGKVLPEAIAIVHPGLNNYRNPHLSGVGVAFKLAQALLNVTAVPNSRDRTFLDSLLKLVALGTIADMVPLIGENALLVKRGLTALSGYNGPGLTELIKATKTQKRLRSQHISFNIGPHINAVGRMGEARDAVKLLLTRDVGEAKVSVKHVSAMNTERRNIQRALNAVLPPPDGKHFDLVVETNAHKGVIGVIAGQRMKATGRPSAVCTVINDVVYCSARVPSGYDLQPMVSALRPYLLSGGGHRCAASLTFTIDKLNVIKTTLELIATEQAKQIIAPAAILVDGIGTELVPSLAELERMEPFGQAFPEPLLIVAGKLAAPMQVFDKGYKKFRLLGESHQFTSFNLADNVVDTNEEMCLAVAPMDHDYWGRSWRVEALVASPGDA